MNETTQNGFPKVSVIIPAYNTAQYIGEAVASVFAQTFTDYEVIVINDGSQDTAELERVLEPYGGSIRYFKKEDGGTASARNFAIRQAKGRYVALLDSDDVWEPDYLAAQVAALDANPAAVVSYTNAIICGDSPHAGKDYMSLHPSEGEVTLQRLVEQQCNVLGGAAARRKELIEAGLFDESLRSSEDFDLWLRILNQGGGIIYLRQTLWRYRKRAGSLTKDALAMWRSYLRVLEKTQRTMQLSPADRKAVERRCDYVRAHISLFEGKQAFFAGHLEVAIRRLTQANTFLKSWKLALALRLLRLAPQLERFAYDSRDRFVYRTSTKL